MKIKNTTIGQILLLLVYHSLMISTFYFYALGLLWFAKKITPDAVPESNNFVLLITAVGLLLLWLIVLGFVVGSITEGLVNVLSSIMDQIQNRFLKYFAKVLTYVAFFWIAGQTLIEAGNYFDLNLTINFLTILAISIGFGYLLFFIYHFKEGHNALHKFYGKLFLLKRKEIQ